MRSQQIKNNVTINENKKLWKIWKVFAFVCMQVFRKEESVRIDENTTQCDLVVGEKQHSSFPVLNIISDLICFMCD